jgi:hypothetical protein
LVLLLAAPARLAADDDDGALADAFAGIEITGFVDAHYSYDFDVADSGGAVPFRTFDGEHDELNVSLVELAVEQKPTAARRVGFRLDLDFGPTTDTVHAAEPGGTETFKPFEQVYLSYLAPGGVQVDVGKFVTPFGAEVIEAKDNWNYTRGLLFGWGIPFYHAGVRAAVPVGDKLTLTGFFVNGWDNARENNGGKSVGLQAAFKPTGALTLVQGLMTGPEQLDNDDDRRFLSDTIVTWHLTPKLSLMANYDYGRDQLAGARVTWSGIAAYARWQVTDAWALAPRVERFEDADGFRTGAAQTIDEVTLTSEHRLADALVARLEYRRDKSDQPFFVRDGRPADTQSTLALGLIYAFGAKL